MAEEAEEKEPGEESAEEPVEEKKGLFTKKKLLFIFLPALLVLGGGGAGGAYYMGMFGGASSEQAEAAAEPSVYYDLPEMVVNLASNGQRAQFLKIKISLEAVDDEIVASLEPVLPRILDMFQIYLRELRSGDLEGSAGIYRLKEELLKRINLAIQPKQVSRVLFKEIIVQ